MGLEMGKRIILLSDGTGNSAAKVWRTNVWRVFESLELSASDQVAFYDDGVGTSSFLPLAILGGAFGWGLKRNVLDLYKFLCRNYSSDEDEIFAFGFSRGAFTIRVLIGLVINQGLVAYNSEAELDRKIRAAYRAFRMQKFKSTFRLEAPFRWLWHCFVSASHDATERPVKRIRFLGLWDTVAAYGLPIEEMMRDISRYLFPLELPDRYLDLKVKRACHALSLDDERTTFHPVLWDESNESLHSLDGERYTRSERISQVWFAGVHTNVGGGYPDDSLAFVSLNWIMSEAAACGLQFKRAPNADPDTIIHALSAQDKDGRLYDSRSGIGGYYRYGPRKLADLCKMILSNDPRDRVVTQTPKIHASVFDRIKAGAHLYAPIGLPQQYEVVEANGRIVPSTNCESVGATQARCRVQETTWNFVWRRRVIYFLTVFSSVYLLSYPFYHLPNIAGEFDTPLRYVSNAVRLAGRILPSVVEPWMDSYAQEPDWFVLVALIVGILIYSGSRLGSQITDRMDSIWQVTLRSSQRKLPPESQWPALSPFQILLVLIGLYAVAYPWLPSVGWLDRYSLWSKISGAIGYYTALPIRGIAAVFLIAMLLPSRFVFKLRTSWVYKKTLSEIKLRIAPAFFALLFVYLGVTLASHSFFNLLDFGGAICRETSDSDQLPNLARGQSAVIVDGKTVAQRLRPFAQRAASDATLSEDDKTNPFKYLPRYGVELPEFHASELCQRMGVKVEQFGSYNIKFDTTANFTDWDGVKAPFGYYSFGIISNPSSADVPAEMSVMEMLGAISLLPLRRELSQPWYRIVARIGGSGGQQKAFEPDFTDDYIFDDNLKAERPGELFLFVNDPVVGIPKLHDIFYKRNVGAVKVIITRN
jgi:uncharacterized protein (DUF2235 family)